MTYRVWWRPEFPDPGSAELAADNMLEDGWKVPDEPGIFDSTYRHVCSDPEEAAQKYAEYFYFNRDGHEDKWPQEFVVHDGAKFFVVSVEAVFDPSFEAGDPVELDPITGHLAPLATGNR